MPKYAVKIGEIELHSDKPITEEDRKRAIADMARGGTALFPALRDGLEISVIVR